MFYSSHVLTKKGPLAKIWLAAHMQSKLTKAMIFQTDIAKAVETIFSPDAPMALRLTSNLLLGVVRILYRKSKYLLQESSDALAKLKTTYKSSAAASRDLPPATAAASFAAVTLASTLDDTLTLPAPAVDLSQLPERRRSTAPHSFLAADRDITIHEFAGGLSGGILDAFADEPHMERGAEELGIEMLEGVDEPLVFTPSQGFDNRDKGTPSVRSAPGSVEVTRAAPVDEAVQHEAPILSIEREGGLKEGVDDVDQMRQPELAGQTPSLMDDYSPPMPAVDEDALPMPEEELDIDAPPRPSSVVDVVMDDANEFELQEGPSPGMARISTGADEFELAEEGEQAEGTQTQPGDGSAPTKRGRKRKRLLIEDQATELSVEAFRDCLNDTSDLLLPPRARRRGADRVRGRRPTTYEDLLARPAIVLAPELNELFAQSFHIEEARQVGSPMSDADLLEKRDGEKEGEQQDREEERGEDGLELETPEKAAAPQKPAKEVVADPEITPLRAAEDGDVALSQRGIDDNPPSRRTDDVPTSPVQDEMFGPDEAAGRRSSLGTDNVPMPEGEESYFQDSSAGLDFDKAKISLKDVAITRAQVDTGGDKVQANGETDDVTENTISARTHKMQEYIMAHLDDDGELNYSKKLTAEPDVSRRTAARSFYELLNLSTKKALQLSQDGAFGTIKAKPLQPVFDSLAKTGIA